MTDDRTDEELVARLGQDPEALGALFDRYAGGLRAWLLRVTGDAALAEDLTAETFVVAWGAGRRFRRGAGAGVGAWLHGIARNLVHRSWERRGAERRMIARSGRVLATAHRDDCEAVDARIDAERRASTLDAALAELPHDLRAALHLRVLQDLPYDQVAVELSCSVAAARQRVSRALRHLTTSLEEAPPCPTS